MKLLIDMNLSPALATFLIEAGMEAEHWEKLGSSRASDSEIMAYAKAHDFIVITHDLDFSAILATTGGAKPSVVQIRATDISPRAIGKSLLEGLWQMKNELDRGALLTIDLGRSRTRLRLLPLLFK